MDLTIPQVILKYAWLTWTVGFASYLLYDAKNYQDSSSDTKQLENARNDAMSYNNTPLYDSYSGKVLYGDSSASQSTAVTKSKLKKKPGRIRRFFAEEEHPDSESNDKYHCKRGTKKKYHTDNELDYSTEIKVSDYLYQKAYSYQNPEDFVYYCVNSIFVKEEEEDQEKHHDY